MEVSKGVLFLSKLKGQGVGSQGGASLIRVRFFGMIQIRISDPISLGSWQVK